MKDHEALAAYADRRDADAFRHLVNDYQKMVHGVCNRVLGNGSDAEDATQEAFLKALQRLGFLLGETRYLDAAERTLRSAWQAIEEYPHGHVSLLKALEEFLHHPQIIVIRGQTEELARWQDSAAKVYAPRRMIFAINADEPNLPGALADRKSIEGETVAYKCVGTHCGLPVTTFEALAAELSEATD